MFKKTLLAVSGLLLLINLSGCAEGNMSVKKSLASTGKTDLSDCPPFKGHGSLNPLCH